MGGGPRSSGSATEPPRRVATFSIAARDPANGDLGVAVQSKFPNVRVAVPFAKAGVGAVATQSFSNTDFGTKGLELLALGATPQEVLAIIGEAGVSASVVEGLEKAGALERVEMAPPPIALPPDPDAAPPTLNEEQAAAMAQIREIDVGGFGVALLDDTAERIAHRREAGVVGGSENVASPWL